MAIETTRGKNKGRVNMARDRKIKSRNVVNPNLNLMLSVHCYEVKMINLEQRSAL